MLERAALADRHPVDEVCAGGFHACRLRRGSGTPLIIQMRAQPHERDGARESKQLKQLIASHGAPGLA